MKRLLLGALLGALVASASVAVAQEFKPILIGQTAKNSYLFRIDDPDKGVSCYYFVDGSGSAFFSATCLKT